MKNSLARSFFNSFVPINPPIVLSPSDMCSPVGSLSSSVANRSWPSARNRDTTFRVRILSIQSVTPNRIEFVQLIVQQVATIFCHKDGVLIVRERNIIERSMVGVTQDNERDVSSVAACVEIDTEDSAPGTARCQHRVIARDAIRIASDREEKGLKM